MRRLLVSLVLACVAVPLSAAQLGGLRIRLHGQQPATSCALPNYPNATCTGYAPTGVTLTAYAGATNITANTTLDSKEITSCLQVHNSATLTITRSWIHPSAFCSFVLYNDLTDGGGSIVVSDTLIDCGNFVSSGNSTGIYSDNWTATRLDITRCENGVWAERGVISLTDSYVHNLYCYSATTDPHIDGVQVPNGATFTSLTVQHNTLWGSCELAIGTSGFDGNSSFTTGGNMSNALFDSNLVGGGQYSTVCADINNPPNLTNYRVTNNHYSNRFHSTVGASGPQAECSNRATTFSGNVCHESGVTVTGATTVCGNPPAPSPEAWLRQLWYGAFAVLT